MAALARCMRVACLVPRVRSKALLLLCLALLAGCAMLGACNLIGSDVEAGILPNDDALVGNMVKNICYSNAKAYLGLLKS